MKQLKNLSPESKGDIYHGLLALADDGQVKRCKYLHLSNHELFYSGSCDKDYADFVDAPNVDPPEAWGSHHSPYRWPQCPANCPAFEPSPDLAGQLTLDQYEREAAVNALARAMNQKKVPLVLPEKEKVTFAWLWANVSTKLWLQAIIFTILVFFIGAICGPPFLQTIERVLIAFGWLKHPLTSP